MTKRKPTTRPHVTPDPTPPHEPDEAPLRHQYLWLDLETTGLDPFTGTILECAVVLADDDGPGATFDPVDALVITLHFDREKTDLQIAPVVERMHEASGLWAACRAEDKTTDVRALDTMLVMFVEAQGHTAPKHDLVLAGSSVHFDLAWIRAHCPRFAAFLSHRVYDVSTLKAEAVRRGLTLDVQTGETEHRALADIQYSLRTAAAFAALTGAAPE